MPRPTQDDVDWKFALYMESAQAHVAAMMRVRAARARYVSRARDGYRGSDSLGECNQTFREEQRLRRATENALHEYHEALVSLRRYEAVWGKR